VSGEAVAPAGIVLAAGAGTRFAGGVKQLAPLRGRPLLAYSLEAMLAVPALDPVVVVLGHAAADIAAAIDFHGATVVVNGAWDEGQSTSLKRGVDAAGDADAVVVTLGDQPLITSQVIAGALDQLAGCDAVRVTYGGAPGHPVVLSRRVMDAVGELEGDTGARDLLARFRVRQWEAGHLCSAADVDTREELARL
jgi:molybdenum cofactor cytidylyltransferase